jgi:hypothetical protein
MTLLAALVSGCTNSEKLLPDDVILPPSALVHGTATVLGAESDQPLALGAVLRVTYEQGILLASVAPGEAGPFRVRLPGDPPVPAHLLGREDGLVVLSFLRSGRDLRPLELAPDPPAPLGQALFLPSRAARLTGPLPCQFAADMAGKQHSPGLAWLASAPALDDDDDRSSEERAASSQGGLVLDRQRRLLGLVAGTDGTRPRVLVASQAVQDLEAPLLATSGADLVRPDDVFLVYSVKVESPDLPPCADEDGTGPMLVLELRVAGDLAGRIEVTPGRPILETPVATRAVGPLTVQFVALDRNLAQGETRVELSKPASFFALAPRLDVTLELDKPTLERYPGPRPRPRIGRVRLVFEAVDPDRATGGKRTPALAPAILLGRSSEGALDLAGGKASEFSTITDGVGEGVLAFLFRRRLGGPVALAAFQPGFGPNAVAGNAPARGPHLSLFAGRLPRGRSFLRVRQIAGEEPVPYELLVVPATDAAGVIAPLFRLVNREVGKEGTAFMDSDAFVDEVAVALDDSGLNRDALSRAVLDELGGHVFVTRRLGFGLLERHLLPSRALLEEAFAAGGSSAQDAGLILAELDPREPKVRPVVRRAAFDPDPYIRARAVRVASRSGDATFADEVAGLCAQDDAPIVERAVAAARLNAALLRQPPR